MSLEDYQDMFGDNIEITHTGGATGSGRMTGKDGLYYQVKNSILDAPWTRQARVGGGDIENFGEFIAAGIANALAGNKVGNEKDVENKKGFEDIPQVKLIYDAENKRVKIGSRYLENVEGTLDDFAKKTGGVESDKKHVKISFDPKDKGKKGVFYIGDDERFKFLKKDLAKATALSLLTGDHDVNPGNMMVVKDTKGQSRIARIDFGHAYNDLISTSGMFGGQVRNKENYIMDFLNRDTVGHLLPNRRDTKLWRDYTGLVPSEELAEAFKEISQSESARLEKGLKEAHSSFKQLIDKLSSSPGNQKEIEHVKSSLVAISNNAGGGKINTNLSAEAVLEKVFKNIGKFCAENQRQMHDVSQLMTTQLKVDKLILDQKEGKKINRQELSALKAEYENLKNIKGIGRGKADKIEWIKNSKNSPPFKGNLQQYMSHRAKELGLDKETRRELIASSYPKSGKGPISSPSPKPKNFFEQAMDKIEKLGSKFIELLLGKPARKQVMNFVGAPVGTPPNAAVDNKNKTNSIKKEKGNATKIENTQKIIAAAREIGKDINNTGEKNHPTLTPPQQRRGANVPPRSRGEGNQLKSNQIG